MEPLAISFFLRFIYDLLPNATNLKLWGYTNWDLCLSCKSDPDTLRHVLSACPHSLQMYTWWHNKVSVVRIELRAQRETANQQSITAKEPIIYFLKEGECPVRKQKILTWGYWTENFSRSQDISTISSSHYPNRKVSGHCSMVRFKEKCPPHRIDCPLGRKPRGSTRAEEKPLRDTACWLCGKGLDMPCDSYWGWLSWFYRTLSHFVSFKNRNHWP